MTLSEFKAWFEGFTEDMEAAPSEKQWERVKARVAEITGQPLSYPVYVDRYVRSIPAFYNGLPYATCDAIGSTALGVAPKSGLSAISSAAFDSHKAMAALGRDEAQSMKAA